MQRLARLFLDSLFVGLALAILFLCGLVVTDIGGVGRRILTAPDGYSLMALVLVFSSALFASVQFSVTLLRLEMAEDRAIERRKREGWGNSPRDRPDQSRHDDRWRR